MKFHLFLHSKGGIGKSHMAAATADYLQRREVPIFCVDCDPSTDTFRRIKALDVRFFSIMEGDEVDSRKFDDMLLTILNSGAEHAVVDSGSGGYQALTDYFAQSDMFNVLADQGHQAYLHTIIVGGGMMGNTVDGFLQLVKLFPNIRFVLWLNPKDGPVLHNGKPFVHTDVYLRHRHLIKATIELPSLNKHTYMRDLSTMLARAQTYADAFADPGTNFIVKHRLDQLRRLFDVLLDEAFATLAASVDDAGNAQAGAATTTPWHSDPLEE